MTHCCLTIDLEDYKHATMRDMGIRPVINPDQAERGLDAVFELLDRSNGDKNITLFTTGQIARDQAALVRHTADLGNEIACHSNLHENILELNSESFHQNLCNAIGSLEDATGEKVLGFRAPNFSINESCLWAFDILKTHGILYDSSLVSPDSRVGKPFLYDVITTKTGSVYEFPLYSCKLFGLMDVRVIGGTYLRLLPADVIINLMKKMQDAGYLPMIYLHVADIDNHFTAVKWCEMKGLTGIKRVSWILRQNQWSFGTASALDKLEKILKVFPNKGPMVSLVKGIVE
ncbi:MAG TPA: DUF3473 domain-containing protein [Spirochaetes bacterium]|nr:DUF3473 domain-containing protein [Spirochaetota bacterium]